MKVRRPIDVAGILASRDHARLMATAERYHDEAAELALAGKPRRAGDVEVYARRVEELAARVAGWTP